MSATTTPKKICPAPAGMSPRPLPGTTIQVDLPRTCGDEPTVQSVDGDGEESAPHLRG